MNVHSEAQHVWRNFCDRMGVEQDAVPLFEHNAAGAVMLKKVGRGATSRQVLGRSPAMEALVKQQVGKLLQDFEVGAGRYDGLIYMMGRKEGQAFEPLYIGKTETLGRGDGNLSANITGLDAPSSKFARWGYNYAYHLGDLSACALPGHAPEKRTIKYEAWAKELFVDVPSEAPRLKSPIWFWTMAWDNTQVGVWRDLGPTRLAFLEYLLIGVASLISPRLLNREGLARGSAG